MEFKDKIKQRREELNLTLQEVADKVGVTAPTIQRYESGEIKNVRRDKIDKLSKALDVTPSYLMGWEDEPPAETEPEILEKFPDDIVILARGAKTLTKDQIDLVRNLIDNMNKQNED